MRNYVDRKKIYGIPDRDYFFDSWLVIIIALIWFFPIGLILLFRKRALHRRNLFTSGNMSIGVGIFLMMMGYLYLVILQDSYMDEVSFDITVFVTVCLLIAGLITFGFGILTKMTAARYRKYIGLVVNRRIEDINMIAQEMKTSRKRVIKDLDVLISKRYLEKYVIDEVTNKIYIPEDLIAKKRQEEIIREEQEKLKRVVECKGCGARNYLKERVGRCEYCNSYIE